MDKESMEKALKEISDLSDEVLIDNKIRDVMVQHHIETFVKTLHTLGRRVEYAQGLIDAECNTCKALGYFIAVAPLDELPKVLKQNFEEFKEALPVLKQEGEKINAKYRRKTKRGIDRRSHKKHVIGID